MGALAELTGDPAGFTVEVPPADDAFRRIDVLNNMSDQLKALIRDPGLPDEQRAEVLTHLSEIDDVRTRMMRRLRAEIRRARKQVRRIVSWRRVCAPRVRPREHRPRRVR